MGLILCKKHGKSGMVFSCSHLNYFSRKKNKPLNIVKRDERDNPDDDYDWLKGHRIYCLCNPCDEKYKELKFADFSGNFSGNFFSPNCGKCFLELLNLETWY